MAAVSSPSSPSSPSSFIHSPSLSLTHYIYISMINLSPFKSQPYHHHPTMSQLSKSLLLITLLSFFHHYPLQCTGSPDNNHHDQDKQQDPPEFQTLETNPTQIKFNPRVPLSSSKRFEGSSELVNLKYHMGPVLSSPINIYLIWYGKWSQQHKLTIKDFLLSISDARAPSPSVANWWRTVSLYTDQTGANISRSVSIAGEYSDTRYSHGNSLTRLSVQQVIATAVKSKPFPVDHRNGIYLVLTASDVTMEDFCRAVCGFHYFTFPSMVGYTLPYAWIGNSGRQCPEVCAYPFAVPAYMGGGGPGQLTPPNSDVGVDGMISVIGHELAELSSNPLVNAWYAGEDPTAPTEIGDLCEGLYGTGGGGGYIGQVMKDRAGRTYNLNGRSGRKFLVQWIWSPVLKACSGPNAMD